MNQQPDKFFRDKLSDYQHGVSSDTWNRVSHNLQKRRRGLWLRYAASLLFLTISGIAIYSSLKDQTTETQTALSENKAPAKDHKAENTIPAPVDKQHDLHSSDSSRSVTPLPKEKPAQSAPNQKPSHTINSDSEKALLALTETTSPTTEGISDQTDEVPQQDPAPAIKTEENIVSEKTILPEESRGGTVTIVFTAEEVNKKYLKKNATVEATSEPKASSGLRKLLDKASDLTTNQDLLGDLRQKKNEIFAMNFKSEKQRSENQ